MSKRGGGSSGLLKVGDGVGENAPLSKDEGEYIFAVDPTSLFSSSTNKGGMIWGMRTFKIVLLHLPCRKI